MAGKAQTIKQLKAEIDTDLSTFVNNYVNSLKQTTPVLTGRAKAGWKKTYKKGTLGAGRPIPIAQNNVPYIGVLDDGWSRQAPRGIVQPALQSTRKK